MHLAYTIILVTLNSTKILFPSFYFVTSGKIKRTLQNVLFYYSLQNMQKRRINNARKLDGNFNIIGRKAPNFVIGYTFKRRYAKMLILNTVFVR